MSDESHISVESGIEGRLLLVPHRQVDESSDFLQAEDRPLEVVQVRRRQSQAEDLLGLAHVEDFGLEDELVEGSALHLRRRVSVQLVVEALRNHSIASPVGHSTGPT